MPSVIAQAIREDKARRAEAPSAPVGFGWYVVVGVLGLAALAAIITVIVWVVMHMGPKDPTLCDQVTRAGHADAQTYANACR